MIVKRGLSVIVPQKVVKIGWESNFGELLRTVKPGFDTETICKVTISTNERFVDPVHEVDVSAPISVCDTFNCRFVCIFIQDHRISTLSDNTGVWVCARAYVNVHVRVLIVILCLRRSKCLRHLDESHLCTP